MAEPQLRSLGFRLEREDAWRRLETLLDRVEKRSAAVLDDEEMIALPALYRAALSALSVARATSLDQALIDYLESLCARAYFYVYGPRTPLIERVGRFFVHDWPAAVRAQWRETIAAFVIMLAGATTAYVLTALEADWFFSFVPEAMSQGRNPHASQEFLRDTLYAEEGDRGGLSVFATFLFTHNAQIAIFSFALGFALCLPTVFLVAYNGCSLGAFFALYGAHGLTYEFGGWVFIHGVTELFAIILAAAAGLRIGWAIAFPGARSRLGAAEEAGRQGGVVMIGVVIMLMIAGLLEGFGRQLILHDALRWVIAGASLIAWTAYFYFWRRARADG